VKFDPTKPVQTRGGLPARIVCTDRKHPVYTLVALITSRPGVEEALFYTADGQYIREEGYRDSIDLINIPERHVHADLIIAWANGATIQKWVDVLHETRLGAGVISMWKDDPNPSWLPADRYQIKP